MRRKRKQKKKIPQPQMSGYKKFIIDMYEALKINGLHEDFKNISSESKHTMYEYRLHLSNPEAIDDRVSPRELQLIAEKTKLYYRERSIKRKDTKLSAYQLMLIYCYLVIKAKIVAKELKDKNHPIALNYNDLSNKIFTTYATHFILNCMRIIIQMGSPDHKYYGMNMRIAAIHKDNLLRQHKPEIDITYPRKHTFKINGMIRPAFQIGMVGHATPVEWLSIDSSLIKNSTNTLPAQLDVYIQSHAIKRMEQRLDLLDKLAVNYTLWENTHTITEFITHRGYLLLPVKLYEVKVGYLLADVVNDKLLFKTFLFVTHNFTPEGDKLRHISGLGKEDISYWKIDRLSTFANLDENKYPKLANLFKQAGLEDLFHLKEKDFDVDKIQTANLDGLRNYIYKGENAHKIQEQEFNELLQKA